MDNNETAVACTAIIFSPVILFALYRINRANQPAVQGPADLAQTQALMATAERMDRRIDSLEMLLDSELPGWRSRSRNP